MSNNCLWASICNRQFKYSCIRFFFEFLKLCALAIILLLQTITHPIGTSFFLYAFNASLYASRIYKSLLFIPSKAPYNYYTHEYEKGLQDQTNEIEELRKKLEVAKRDNSIQGLKRQRELAEELTKAEEELAEYTQNKIDEDYEKNIDAEIEKIEEEKDALLGALEEQFNEVNIAKMVQSALTSGFVEINGELKSIQELLMESINNTADAYSVMGATIKQELVDNLNIALSTMKELESIYSDLNLSNYGLISSNIPSTIPTNNYNTNTRNITVGETNITINGSVSNDILDDIENLIEQKNNEMLRTISRDL